MGVEAELLERLAGAEPGGADPQLRVGAVVGRELTVEHRSQVSSWIQPESRAWAANRAAYSVICNAVTQDVPGRSTDDLRLLVSYVSVTILLQHKIGWQDARYGEVMA